MYIHVAKASVPTIRVAAAMAKITRLSRLGRRIGHISANEVDFMIRTKKGKFMSATGWVLLFTKWPQCSSRLVKKFGGARLYILREC